jgi:hypothetical protein
MNPIPPDRQTNDKGKSRLVLFAALMTIISFGIVCIYLSEKLQSALEKKQPSNSFPDILHEMGVLLVTVIAVLVIYEFIMRKHLLGEIKKELKGAIDEAGIQKDILEIIQKTMPASYMNLINSGVSDAFLHLSASNLIKRIEKNKNVIKISKIWMPFISLDIGKDIIIKSIERGNSYRIVLCDYKVEEALSRRARMIKDSPYSIESYQYHIRENIDFFNSVWVELKKKGGGLESKIEFRLHNDFIAAALIGFDDYFLFGLYLNGKLATKGMQFKIEKNTLEGSTFYIELEDHFEMQWESAYIEVQFSEDGFKCVERDVKKIT